MADKAKRRKQDECLAELVARIQSGDETAIEEWYKVLYPYALALARRALPDEVWVEDAADVALLHALKIIKQYERRPAATYRSYFYVVAGRRISNFRRSLGRTLCVTSLDDCPKGAASCPGPQDPRNRLRYQPERLPPKLKEVWQLRYEEGLTYEEIGKRLGIAARNATQRVYRARMKLREIM